VPGCARSTSPWREKESFAGPSLNSPRRRSLVPSESPGIASSSRAIETLPGEGERVREESVGALEVIPFRTHAQLCDQDLLSLLTYIPVHLVSLLTYIPVHLVSLLTYIPVHLVSLLTYIPVQLSGSCNVTIDPHNISEAIRMKETQVVGRSKLETIRMKDTQVVRRSKL
jgi:hypothetical protein